LRHLEFLKHAVCSAKSISPATSTVPLVKKVIAKKTTSAVSKAKPTKAKLNIKETKESKIKIDTNKLAEETNEIKVDENKISQDEKLEKIEKEMDKINGIESIIADIEKIEKIEADVKKLTHKSKHDMKNVKSKVDSRAPSKSIDRKRGIDKKIESSPPATPKKSTTVPTATMDATVTSVNSTSVTKSEKPKQIIKSKPSPTSTPAKSAKDANNRKVVEARVTSKSTLSKTTTARQIKKEESVVSTAASTVAPKTVDRKPISRRPRTMTATAKPDSLPKKAMRKLPIDLIDKASTDSTVSTPSAEVDINKPKAVDRRGKRAQEVKTEKEKAADELESTKEKTEETEVKAVSENEIVNDILQDVSVKLTTNMVTTGEGEDLLVVTTEEVDERKDYDLHSQQEDLETKDETEGEGELNKLQKEAHDSEKKRNKVENENQVQDEIEEGQEVCNVQQSENDIKESETQRIIKEDEVVSTDARELGKRLLLLLKTTIIYNYFKMDL